MVIIPPALLDQKKTVAAELFALREIMKIRYKTTLSSSALFLPMKTTILEKNPDVSRVLDISFCSVKLPPNSYREWINLNVCFRLLNA